MSYDINPNPNQNLPKKKYFNGRIPDYAMSFLKDGGRKNFNNKVIGKQIGNLTPTKTTKQTINKAFLVDGKSTMDINKITTDDIKQNKLKWSDNGVIIYSKRFKTITHETKRKV